MCRCQKSNSQLCLLGAPECLVHAVARALTFDSCTTRPRQQSGLPAPRRVAPRQSCTGRITFACACSTSYKLPSLVLNLRSCEPYREWRRQRVRTDCGRSCGTSRGLRRTLSLPVRTSRISSTGTLSSPRRPVVPTQAACILGVSSSRHSTRSSRRPST
jgi:hypothetical protein